MKDNQLTLGDLMKRARRKTVIKTTIISILSSLFVFFALYWMGKFVIEKKIDHHSSVEFAWSSIQGANVVGASMSYAYSPFTATVTTEMVKDVGGVPVPWGTNQSMFTMVGTERALTSPASISSTHELGQRAIHYFQGQRVIEFYHPEIDYLETYDDRTLLNNIPESTVVEMAFSFDQPYSIDEVIAEFGDQLTWFWVDTLTEEEIDFHNRSYADRNNEEFDGFYMDQTIIGNAAHGYKYFNASAEETAQTFIHMLEYLQETPSKRDVEVDQVISALTNEGEKELTPENIEVIGVVVTGFPDELSRYTENEKVRGATLGATTSRFD